MPTSKQIEIVARVLATDVWLTYRPSRRCKKWVDENWRTYEKLAATILMTLENNANQLDLVEMLQDPTND